MKRVEALAFADQLRSAREVALKDAEAFDAIIHAVERLGSFLTGKILDLGKYKKELEKLSDAEAKSKTLIGELRAELIMSHQLNRFAADQLRLATLALVGC